MNAMRLDGGCGRSPHPGSTTRRRAGRSVAVLRVLVSGLLVAGLAGGCDHTRSYPDILLVTIDTLRADHCSAYGYEVPTTPSLDALAGRGILFHRAYSECSTTSPSHAVLMTGRHFRTLGVTRNGGTVPEKAVTLAEALGQAGYATAAFVSSFPVKKRFGFAQGFEVFDDEFTEAETSIGRGNNDEAPHDRVGGATLAHCRRWLESRRDKRPLFLWVHFVDPHAPYHAPEPFDVQGPDPSRPVLARYDGEVHYADKQLGLLLDEFAKWTPGREDFAVVTSDHGEGLGDHGWSFHGVNLYEEAVRVPLVASWPGHLPEGVVENSPVGIIDIAPGILAAVGISAEGFDHGRPLFEAIDPARPLFLQRREYASTMENGRKISGDMSAVVRGSEKLIQAPGEKIFELYDLAADPHEAHELLRRSPPGHGPRGPRASAAKAAKRAALADPVERARHEATARRLEDLLNEWKEAFPEAATEDAPMDSETREALRALGYVD